MGCDCATTHVPPDWEQELRNNNKQGESVLTSSHSIAQGESGRCSSKQQAEDQALDWWDNVSLVGATRTSGVDSNRKRKVCLKLRGLCNEEGVGCDCAMTYACSNLIAQQEIAQVFLA